MIHIFNQQQAGVGDWEVWSDPADEEKYGRCIGTGPTRDDAVHDALMEMEEDIRQLKRELP